MLCCLKSRWHLTLGDSERERCGEPREVALTNSELAKKWSFERTGALGKIR